MDFHSKKQPFQGDVTIIHDGDDGWISNPTQDDQPRSIRGKRNDGLVMSSYTQDREDFFSVMKYALSGFQLFEKMLIRSRNPASGKCTLVYAISRHFLHFLPLRT